METQMARRTQQEDPVNRFDRFAESISQFVSQGDLFTAAVVIVVIWIPTIFFISSIDTWQLVINTLTSVLAFLLIALLQNSERRYDDALHHKIDTIAVSLADLVEQIDGRDPDEVRRDVEALRESIELERRM